MEQTETICNDRFSCYSISRHDTIVKHTSIAVKECVRSREGFWCMLTYTRQNVLGHQWQRGPVYKFALRVLLQDWIGTESWITLFDEMATALGFTAASYVAMTSDADRSASLSELRGVRVMATIKKRINNNYVNYNVSELEVLGGAFPL